MSNTKIVTLTLNPALDKSTTTSRLIPEQKMRCTPLRFDAGGGGINVSKGISRLEGKSIAVFPIGGHNGNILKSLVEAQGVEVNTLDIAGDSRENLSVTDETTNLQYRFTLPGLTLTPAMADQCLARIKSYNPEFLVASGSLPPGLPVNYFEQVAAFSKKIGAKFVLDTSGEALQAAADEGLYLLKPNLAELSALVGVEKLEMNEVDDAALQIIHQGKCQIVVVSLGPQGALLVTKAGFEHIPAPAVKKQSTVGAGDSMVAGMIWALSEGQNFLEMAQTGVACGSAATMNQGTELFHKKDVLRLLDWIKNYGSRLKFTDF